MDSTSRKDSQENLPGSDVRLIRSSTKTVLFLGGPLHLTYREMLDEVDRYSVAVTPEIPVSNWADWANSPEYVKEDYVTYLPFTIMADGLYVTIMTDGSKPGLKEEMVTREIHRHLANNGKWARKVI